MLTKKLTYYVDKGNSVYEEMDSFYSTDIGEDGVVSRQMVHYRVKNGRQYKAVWNEQASDLQDCITLKDEGPAKSFFDEYLSHFEGVTVEFRTIIDSNNMPYITRVSLSNHFDVITRYLTKDAIFVPGVGLKNVDSFEIDDDRRVYVIYLEA